MYVWLDPTRLRERGIDVLGLKTTLSASNLRMPSGSVLEGDGAGQMLAVETARMAMRIATGRKRRARGSVMNQL